MQKKIQNDLRHLAHSILQMKDNEEVITLHQKAAALYEQLTLLKFVNHYVDDSLKNKKITENADSEPHITTEEVTIESKEEKIVPTEEIPLEENLNEEVQNTSEKMPPQKVEEETESQNTELKPKEENTLEKLNAGKKLIRIPLSDRILIVNDLFEGNQNDFNRVLSQLNSFETHKEAVYFIKKMVKPDYQWENFTSTEMCLMNYISEKFSD